MVCYIYEHWRPDKNLCFYVGKGSDRRAWEMAHRNPHHKAVVSKLTSLGLAVDIRIIQSDLTSDEAFALEVERIAFYGRDNLCNMTDGGDGASSPTDETRNKISKANKGKIFSPNHRKKLSKAASKRKIGPLTENHKQKIGEAGKGRKFTEIHKQRISNSLKGKKCPPVSDEARKKMSDFQKNRVRKPWTEEQKLNMSRIKKGCSA